MHNHDELNFECLRCGNIKYNSKNTELIAKRILPKVLGGEGYPTCEVCGHVPVRNNGGYSCLGCSTYYELPTKERPVRTLHLMPRREDVLPRFMSLAMIALVCNLIVIMAVVFGG